MFTKGQAILRDLGNGLVMRRSTPEDADALAEFNGAVHGDNEADKQRVAAWTRDLLTRPHPTLSPGDFTTVEETTSGRIVSSLNLIPQTWTYEGIEFGVGRPELVGTLPEFRNRGLVRAQFEEVHKWSAERGDRVQAMTGIPYYYRQFGYEMALDLAGRRFGYEANVPKLKDAEQEPYRIRPANEADLSFVAEVYEYATRRHAIACVRMPEIFKYELDGQSENNSDHHMMLIIEDKAGDLLGVRVHDIVDKKGSRHREHYRAIAETSYNELGSCYSPKESAWTRNRNNANEKKRSVSGGKALAPRAYWKLFRAAAPGCPNGKNAIASAAGKVCTANHESPSAVHTHICHLCVV